MTRLRVGASFFVLLGAITLRAEQAPTVVASDGSGQFKTVQGAIDSIPDQNTEPRVILIKPGTQSTCLDPTAQRGRGESIHG